MNGIKESFSEWLDEYGHVKLRAFTGRATLQNALYSIKKGNRPVVKQEIINRFELWCTSKGYNRIKRTYWTDNCIIQHLKPTDPAVRKAIWDSWMNEVQLKFPKMSTAKIKKTISYSDGVYLMAIGRSNSYNQIKRDNFIKDCNALGVEPLSGDFWNTLIPRKKKPPKA